MSAVLEGSLQERVDELSGIAGIDGCALVEAETGMVWFHAGQLPDIEPIGEAAVEFWRVQGRLAGHFQAFGPLRSLAYSFGARVVAIFPCGERPALVLVCVARKAGVDWHGWAHRVAALKEVLSRRSGPPGPQA